MFAYCTDCHVTKSIQCFAAGWQLDCNKLFHKSRRFTSTNVNNKMSSTGKVMVLMSHRICSKYHQQTSSLRCHQRHGAADSNEVMSDSNWRSMLTDVSVVQWTLTATSQRNYPTDQQAAARQLQTAWCQTHQNNERRRRSGSPAQRRTPGTCHHVAESTHTSSISGT